MEALLLGKDKVTRADLGSAGLSRTEALDRIRNLVEKGRLVPVGGGRSTAYMVVHNGPE